jgi:thioredoxin-like negative regulator of GroEL
VPPTGASDAWRAASRARRGDDGGDRGGGARTGREPPRWEPEEWIDEGELRDEASGAVERSREGRPEGSAGRRRRQASSAPGDAAGTEARAPGGPTPRRRPAGNGAGRPARGGTGAPTGARTGGTRAPTGARTGGTRAPTGARTGGTRAPTGARTGGTRAPTGARTGGTRAPTGARTGGTRAPTGARTGGTRAPTGARTGGAAGAGGAASVDDELRGAVPPGRLPRVAGRLREAGDAFTRGRFEEARRILRPIAEQAPRAPSVRELYGLSLYRLGRWGQAARELEAYRSLTGSVEQNPVLADSYRALGRYAEAEELWDELRAASPRAELVAEGRIVAAGALADQGRLDEAIGVLASGGSRPNRKPQLHHLRMAYALADLYERAGDLPRARELFGRIAASDADFVDVDARLRALR